MVRSIRLWKIALVSLLFLPILLAAETQYEITLVDSVIIPYSYEYVQVTQDSLLRFWDLEIETESITVNTFTLDRQGNLTTPEQVLSAPNEHGYVMNMSATSQIYQEEYRICIGCNNDSLLTLYIFENSEFNYSCDFHFPSGTYISQNSARALFWSVSDLLIATESVVFICNLDSDVVDTLIVFEDEYPVDIPTHLYPLEDQYLIISRDICDWYLMNSDLELIQEIDTYDQFEFEGNTFFSAYPAIEISGGFVVSYSNLAFTELIDYLWVEDNILHLEYGLGAEMDIYPHFANPVSLNDSIFFFTDLGGPFVVLGEYTDDDISYYGGGIAISYGCTVAKTESFCSILRQMDDLHRVRIYDHTFPEYHEEEFSITAPLDPQYHPSMWYNYTMQRHVFFERRYSSYSGENSRFYIFYIDRYQPNSDQDITIPDLALSCYPNPFNPELTVSYSIPQNADVEIAVYNIKGQKVRSLQNEYRDAGDHQVVWDGRNESGQSASSGLYFVRISCGPSELIRKAILLK